MGNVFNAQTFLKIMKCLPVDQKGKPIVTEETIADMGFEITDDVKAFIEVYHMDKKELVEEKNQPQGEDGSDTKEIGETPEEKSKKQEQIDQLKALEKDLKKQAEQLQTQHADMVTKFKAQQADIRTRVKVQRNDPCPCGSGKKYKKCCGRLL